MADPTRPALRKEAPKPPPGWCHWHGDTDPTSAVVIAIDRTSGPPHDQSACAPCRARHGLVALKDLPTTGQPEYTGSWLQQGDDQ